MFKNPVNGKFYPDYRDKIYTKRKPGVEKGTPYDSDNYEDVCYIPSYMKEDGDPDYIIYEHPDYGWHTKKQLEKMKLQPMEGYYGIKLYTNRKDLMKRYYYNPECTEPIKPKGEN